MHSGHKKRTRCVFLYPLIILSAKLSIRYDITYCTLFRDNISDGTISDDAGGHDSDSDSSEKEKEHMFHVSCVIVIM